jgi:hypothetical protein
MKGGFDYLEFRSWQYGSKGGQKVALSGQLLYITR